MTLDKKSVLEKIFSKQETKDYTYAVLFFIISSFFVFFAIRPALSIAFSLNRESFDLNKLNKIYDDNIVKLVELQSNLEDVRSKTYLFDQAIPAKPELKLLIDNIKETASSEGVLIKNLNIAEIGLKNNKNKKELTSIMGNLEITADFPALIKFMKKINNQRRIKTIKNIKIAKEDAKSTKSAELRVIFEIESHYFL